jgi:hypothetical protein
LRTFGIAAMDTAGGRQGLLADPGCLLFTDADGRPGDNGSCNAASLPQAIVARTHLQQDNCVGIARC